jgi:hypothetical protein
VGRWALRPFRPVEQLITTARFACSISTAVIKITDRSWRRPSSFSLSRSIYHSTLTLTLLLLLRLAFDDLGYFLKVMARCSPIDEIAVVNVAEAENLDIVDDPMEMARVIGAELPRASDGEGPTLSAEGVETSAGASDDEHSWTYYFGPSTITRGKIKEMVEKGYFTEGEAHEPRAETIMEPKDDEAVIFDFFITGLRMPLHPVLGDILLNFQA